MLQYIEDPSKDMHKDMAGEIYLLEREDISKEARYSAKNGFVFPVFYGSYYRNTSKSLWDNIAKLHLKTKREEIPLKKHLKEKGIRTLDDFENHLQKVENDFWNRRFKVYKQWKDKWVDNYVKNGFFCSLSGFTYQGIISRNEIINYPVQGVAFHCLLWSFTRLMELIKKKKLKSLIIGQIHDEILFDVVEDELDDIIAISKRVMCDKIKKEWAPWINTHMAIDVEISPIDGRWSELKSEYELRGE
jgi:DNA polymerase-1